MSESMIVTGGAGLIGSNLVAELNRRGADDILIVDHLDPAGLKARNLRGLRYRDFADKTAFREAFRSGRAGRAAAVFHLGACSSTTQTDEAYLRDNNTLYSRELCEWSLRQGARFVYASSAATYGDGAGGYDDDEARIPLLRPLNLYGLSKQAFDLWAIETGCVRRIAGLKYFNVFGPGEAHKGDMRSIVHKAYRQVLDTGEIGLFKSDRPGCGDGEQKRDFLSVRDAVNATLFFHERPDVCGIFNCGTGAARTWLDLARAVFGAMGREPVIRFVDMPATLRGKYQYFTQAETGRLRAAGYDRPFTPLEDAVMDYVRNHLMLEP
jgi:ADP-L-glycero-D-manno-heptose 6-epimerase